MVQPQNKEPERTPAMKTKSVLAASLMTLAIAMPAWSDTLLLRNGGRVNPVYERNQDNRNDNRYQENRDYGQSRMERVVLPVGTEVDATTNERIDSRDVVEGQTFSAQIEEDIRDTDGSVAIPRGSDVWLVTRRVEVNGDITLDVDSISVAGRRYRVSTSDEELQSRKD